MRIECTVKATSDHSARRIFRLASERLLNVHAWKNLPDCLLATSEHRDTTGRAVYRGAKSDDYLNATTEERRLLGWMRVEHVMELPQDNGGEVVMLVRPVDLPFEKPHRRASEKIRPALLRVVWRGLDVTAGVMVEEGAIASVFDRLGAHAIQWRSLVNGILSDLAPLGDKGMDSYHRSFTTVLPDAR